MSREDQHFRLRLPADLREKVEAAAAESRRSLTAEILDRLERSFVKDEAGAEALIERSVQAAAQRVAVTTMNEFLQFIREGGSSPEDIVESLNQLEGAFENTKRKLGNPPLLTTPSTPTPKRPSRAR